MQKFLMRDVLGWGVGLWYIGYVLGFVFYAFVPPAEIGWYVMPLGIAITLYVLWNYIRMQLMRDALTIGIGWSVIAIVCAAALHWFFNRSRAGLAMSAVAEDHQIALAMGISVRRSIAFAWALGGVLSVIGVACLIMGIQTLPNGFSATMGVLFAVAAISIALFFWRQTRAPRPLVDLQAASAPSFWVAAVAGTITFGSLMGALFLGSQFTQNVLGYDALKAALVTLPMSLALMVVSPLAGKMVASKGSRFTLAIGLIVVAIGFVVMVVTWRSGAGIGVVLLAYAIVGGGVGIHDDATVDGRGDLLYDRLPVLAL